jgi:hypothetical protein
MAVSYGSRYSLGTVTRVSNSGGTYNLTVLAPSLSNNNNFSLYVWKSTDRPDLVAYTKLGNANLWWSIFDINPELIDPLNIPPGAVLRIPVDPVMGQGTLSQ